MSGTEDSFFGGLLDAERRHRASPDTFSIPRSDIRRALAPGDRVKLLFGVGRGEAPSAERMWVEVVEASEGRYVGRLANEPEVISDLSPGARVPFGPEHVAAIWRVREDAPRPEQFAIVSDRIWRDGEQPARAVRMPPPDDDFSGWVLFAASDAPAPPEDMAGFQPVSHQDLADRYRAFDSIEDEAPASEWRWDPAELEWRREPT
jgi:hypothetical protein